MPIPNVVDDAVSKEWDDIVVRATTTVSSLDPAQASGNISKTQSTAISNDPFSQEIGLSDRPRCQEAMGGVIAQTRSERASKHSYDSPLPRGNIPRSDEERLEQHDLMDFVPPTPYDSPLSEGHTPRSDEERLEQHDLMDFVPPTPYDSPLSEGHTPRSDEETKGKNFRDETLQDSKRKSLDKENGRNTAEHGDTDNTASIDVSAVRPSNVSTVEPSISTARDIFEDEMMTIADTLVVIRSTRPRTTSVVIRDVEEEQRRATPVPTVQSQEKGKGKMVEPKPTPKKPIKAQIQTDAEIAQKLFEEEQAQFEREQRIAREKAAEQEAKDAALIEKMEDI
ncbi:hypothetical protein Tco_1083982 [Tanacetum coccineum]